MHDKRGIVCKGVPAPPFLRCPPLDPACPPFLIPKIFTIEQVINECAIYDIVDVTDLEHNLQIEENEKDGKSLSIWKVMIKEETWSVEIVLFSSLVGKVSNNTSYDFKKMKVQKFMNDRILKSTETTKISINYDFAIFFTDKELSAFSYEKL